MPLTYVLILFNVLTSRNKQHFGFEHRLENSSWNQTLAQWVLYKRGVLSTNRCNNLESKYFAQFS